MVQTLAEIKRLIKTDYEQKVRHFMSLTPSDKDIIIGDSIIAYLNLRRYGLDGHLINMGIAGDTTVGVLNRMEPVLRLRPKQVILSIGSNDRVLTDLSPEQSVQNILQIKKILESKIQTKVHIVSMTPVLSHHPISNLAYIADRSNEDLQRINSMLKAQLEHDRWIHVYDALLGIDGQLDIRYTTDGIHLNHAGYVLFTERIKQHIL